VIAALPTFRERAELVEIDIASEAAATFATGTPKTKIV
jgi:hypothetical protein